MREGEICMGVGQEAWVGEGIKCKGPEVQPLILLPALSQVYSVGAGFLNGERNK